MKTGDQEGVTKFDLRYEKTPAPPSALIQTLNGWRRILYDLGLIGTEETAAGTIGFGNLSQRLESGVEGGARFLITGTQTSLKRALTVKDYSTVVAWDIATNCVHAQGPTAPSSESLSHAVIYTALPQAGFVFHAHSPAIWSCAAKLNLATTPGDAAYGTPAMANEIRDLVTKLPHADSGIIVMGGHRNGVIAFGDSALAAGQRLIQALAEARVHVSE